MERLLVLATYNVHRFVGRDGRHDPGRVCRVLRELGADVLALQEVLFPSDLPALECAAQLLPELEGYEVAASMRRIRRGRRFGNLLLARPRILDVRRIDLTVHPLEPRNALDADLELPAGSLRVLNAHLGLFPGERRRQFARLVDAMAGNGPLVLLGDFNEWRAGSPLIRRMDGVLARSPELRTYPTPRPFFPLDRIWARPPARVLDLRVHRTPLTARASDHYPVVATIETH